MIKILVIEDDSKTANAIRNGLRGEGYEAAVAKSGEDGLFQLNAETFDLVVLDWMLPGRDGIGIASEHHEKIFDRFYRVDKARSRAGGGHGLGLAIAKSSIDRQGGSIEVESDAGKGSVFRIILPL